MKAQAERYIAGTISREEYDFADTMTRSQLSNMAFYIQSVGEIVILAVIIGIMFAVDVNASQANNNWGLSVLIAFATAVWLLLSLPWFVLEKRRPGQDPGRRNIIMAGLWQLYHAMTQVWKLKQSLIYLIGECRLRENKTKEIFQLSNCSRIFPPRGFAQHHRHRHCHLAEQYRRV
ncbi:hypothetical protein VTN77DRAFT_7403 [Rasamsonia byssochlamydoides]|uniref:uncharacterized protein n=1 Tax=Rasamsonia byssochlamydoides TaxID=89139 RepID=UPI0037446EFE